MARRKESTGGIPMREPFEGSAADVTLFCQDCGREIVRLSVQGDSLVVASPLRRFGMSGDELGGRDPATVMRLSPRALHAVICGAHRDGLDFYCPECDALLCEAHYRIRPVWDDGFYDYALGSCPAGHERIVDD